jgi:pyruvate,orthophosphate dikinase
MFLEKNRLSLIRKFILCDNTQKDKILDELYDAQKEDFTRIFQSLKNLPITIRLLDPPLHEFLPHNDDEIAEAAHNLAVSPDTIKATLKNMSESNPMLGHRGIRVAISMPKLYDIQAKAIRDAAIHSSFEGTLEIMVPLIQNEEELVFIEKRIKEIMKDYKNFKFGTMIELPKAALIADKLSKYCDFFSFGTNDLTQTALGLSRDDSAKFMEDYINGGIYKKDPFVTIDEEGVGELVKIAVDKGLSANKNIKLGICGEHGGDPESIIFFNKIGLNYVSCSPYRLPVARLCAAKACVC